MSQYSFIIPGNPQAWMRPKAFFSQKTQRMWKYDPKENVAYKKKVAGYALAAGIKPMPGCVSLKIEFFLKRPKALYRQRDNIVEIPCSKKPDMSNLLKNIEDGLNGIAFHDDGQVFSVEMRKYYHEKNGVPRVSVSIYGEDVVNG